MHTLSVDIKQGLWTHLLEQASQEKITIEEYVLGLLDDRIYAKQDSQDFERAMNEFSETGGIGLL